MKFRIFFLYLIAVFVIFGAISASEVDAASASSILVNISPANPAPKEEVSITLNSYANNLDSVLIEWFVDGKKVSSGVGKKSFSLTSGAAGSTTSLRTVISLPEGSIEKTITIRPTVMVLLWEANDSHTPPFYKGKAMPTPESEIKIVAMPEIKNVSGGTTNPKNMTYSWRRDYTNEVEGSGYGKNSFLYVNDYLDDFSTVEVVASTIDQKYSSEASIDVGTVQPEIVFYKYDSVLGTSWEEALTDRHRILGPETVVAVPYFISPEEIRTPTLVWNWFINDTMIDVPSWRKNMMPIAAQSGVSGTSNLKLNIESTDKIFQSVSKQISIEF